MTAGARAAPLAVQVGPVVLDACAGDRLIDLCDLFPTPLRFSCRAGSCGTCAVHVLEGADRLSARTDNERIVLAERGDDPAWRLGCQVTVLGSVRLEPASPAAR